MTSALRRQVIERALERCEYCLLPMAFSLMDFEVDHVIAKQHGGRDELNNLALACFRCNRRKGTNVASVDPETAEVVTLFNPRSSDWHEHFSLLETGVVQGKTQIGRVSCHFLQLNHLERVRERVLGLQRGFYQTSQ